MNISSLLGDPALGTAIGIVGLVAAAIFYVRGKREKKFVFANKESVIIGEIHDSLSQNLNVTFDGIDVKRVTRSVFVIWNAGRGTIRKSDIADGDPLRIEFPLGTKILISSIDRTSREAINVSVQPRCGDSTVYVRFEFLDFRDGANLSITHTAPTGAWSFKGTVLGMPDGVQDWGPSATDIEGFRTPKAVKPWSVRVCLFLLGKIIKWALYLVPPVLILSAIFTNITLKVFPSLGRPDMTDVLVSNRVNWYWVFGGLLLLLIEGFVIAWRLKIPPAKLTSNSAAEAGVKAEHQEMGEEPCEAEKGGGGN